jgi:mannose-1-phosphate guanylyltransferase
MKKESIFPVILAGGVGERFWPSSRTNRPKQLLPLLSKKTLFEETLLRAQALAPEQNIVVVTRASLVFAITKALENRKCKIIAEPVGKNTAPAIGAAASWVYHHNPEGIMVVLSSDHRIIQKTDFVDTIEKAVKAANKNHLVVFGVKPVRADTGYGYIKTGKKTEETFAVEQFCEKPDIKKAETFLKNKNYLWNSGIFVWKANRIIEEFQRNMPRLFSYIRELSKSWGNHSEENAVYSYYQKAESQSIDYGIMERAKDVVAIKAQFDWDDVGSWESLWRIYKADKAGNVLKGDTLAIDTSNSLLYGEEGFIVSAGVKDIVVVQSGGVTLVLPRSYLPNMKKITALLKSKKDYQMFL